MGLALFASIIFISCFFLSFWYDNLLVLYVNTSSFLPIISFLLFCLLSIFKKKRFCFFCDIYTGLHWVMYGQLPVVFLYNPSTTSNHGGTIVRSLPITTSNRHGFRQHQQFWQHQFQHHHQVLNLKFLFISFWLIVSESVGLTFKRIFFKVKFFCCCCKWTH